MRFLLLVLLFGLLLVSCESSVNSSFESELSVFVSLLNNHSFSDVYDFFSPDLRVNRSRELFSAYLSHSGFWNDSEVSLISYSLVNGSGVVFLNVSGSVVPFKVSFLNGSWFFYGLEDAFFSSCPVSCVDGDVCTLDVCNESTFFECVHLNVSPCVGDGVCSVGEYPSPDCPVCDDGNPCTVDSYDYVLKACVSSMVENCCGNGVCEVNESGGSCVDCLDGLLLLELGRSKKFSFKGSSFNVVFSELVPFNGSFLASLSVGNSRYVLGVNESSDVSVGVGLRVLSLFRDSKGWRVILRFFEEGGVV